MVLESPDFFRTRSQIRVLRRWYQWSHVDLSWSHHRVQVIFESRSSVQPCLQRWFVESLGINFAPTPHSWWVTPAVCHFEYWSTQQFHDVIHTDGKRLMYFLSKWNEYTISCFFSCVECWYNTPAGFEPQAIVTKHGKNLGNLSTFTDALTATQI